MVKRWWCRLPIALLVAVSAAASASGIVVRLDPSSGTFVKGRGGLHAVDYRSPTVLMRLLSPGSETSEFATIRVLVMNLGKSPFAFGPAQVELVAADGTTLTKLTDADFARGAALIDRERGRAGAIDRSNSERLSDLARSGETGVMPMSPGVSPISNAGSSGAESARSEQRKADDDNLPGTASLDALNELLEPDTVAPQKASGGYLLFRVPAGLAKRHADLPFTIVVTAGKDVHRFAATLKAR
ncbi:hypothetical protein ABDK56_10930 [Sphingomonas sp. ASV193]|uniref:hypothetical protein n=1 Tax=Sphingomonas sp. ASV193 TaxID=3144405 RepID=UPI0032E892E4